MEEVDKEISETRLSLNARTRIVAESYLATVCDPFQIDIDRTCTDVQDYSLHDEVRTVCGSYGIKEPSRLPGSESAKYRMTSDERSDPLSANYTREVLSKTKDKRWKQKDSNTSIWM
jgi:hypothetical protein